MSRWRHPEADGVNAPVKLLVSAPSVVRRRPGSHKEFTAARNLLITTVELLVASFELAATREVSIMNRRQLAAAVLSTAVAVALAMQAAPRAVAQGTANPPQVVKDNMARMAQQHLEKCYGINTAAKNDCAEGAHSCAGQATVARDPKSFVLLPAGDCSKIAGGKTTAS